MLLSLVTVLVLLAIGFYAVSVVATGQIAVGEGLPLSPPKRIIMGLVALLAFVSAYTLYSKPLEHMFFAGRQAGAAAASNPPETRSEPASAPRPVPAPQAVTATTEASPTDSGTATAQSATPAPTPVAPAPTRDSDDDGLSPAAAALEQEAQRRRQSQVLPPAPPVADAGQQEKLESDPSPAVVATVAKPAVAARAADPAPPSRKTHRTRSSRAMADVAERTAPVRRHYYGNTLTVVFNNALGPSQTREVLRLSIEGRHVADLRIDADHPEVEVAVALPRPGLLHYRLEGISDQGKATRVRGEGCIRVEDGRSYEVRRRQGSRKLFLEYQG